MKGKTETTRIIRWRASAGMGVSEASTKLRARGKYEPVLTDGSYFLSLRFIFALKASL